MLIHQILIQALRYIRPKKYTDILQSEIPGVETFFDFDEALAAAKQMKQACHDRFYRP